MRLSSRMKLLKYWAKSRVLAQSPSFYWGLRKLVRGRPERWLYVGMVVIAANAGGAWSPIGDVTTTMLWIGNQISASGVITGLFLPSLVCLLVPLLVLSFRLKGEAPRPRPRETVEGRRNPTTDFERNLVLALGLGSLLFVPVFKTVTHLPPYMGILFGLGVLWVATASALVVDTFMNTELVKIAATGMANMSVYRPNTGFTPAIWP